MDNWKFINFAKAKCISKLRGRLGQKISSYSTQKRWYAFMAIKDEINADGQHVVGSVLHRTEGFRTKVQALRQLKKDLAA
jgi:hypothetical protein